jgi:hypothetical protein
MLTQSGRLSLSRNSERCLSSPFHRLPPSALSLLTGDYARDVRTSMTDFPLPLRAFLAVAALQNPMTCSLIRAP